MGVSARLFASYALSRPGPALKNAFVACAWQAVSVLLRCRQFMFSQSKPKADPFLPAAGGSGSRGAAWQILPNWKSIGTAAAVVAIAVAAAFLAA